MRSGRQLLIGAAGALVLVGFTRAESRLNPMIALLEQGKPIFGLYAPANRRAPRPQQAGATAAAASAQPAPPVKTPAELAQEAMTRPEADYIFDGSMEGDFERGYAPFAEFMKGIAAVGSVDRSAAPRLRSPLMVKMTEIAPDPAAARERIARQLNLGVSGVVFVDVQSAEEVRQGLAMMRFRSQGGTRPDDVGSAPAHWGMSEAEYRVKADLWPLNPKGELLNFTIVESKAGLAAVREIAAVKGIGVLFPGAGTLRSVFSVADSAGVRRVDSVAWEGAIQSVLAACKEFSVPCGYPATEADIELRMKQGFSVFIIAWGEAGFRAVSVGKRVAGRD